MPAARLRLYQQSEKPLLGDLSPRPLYFFVQATACAFRFLRQPSKFR
jgi:hypothetical protein